MLSLVCIGDVDLINSERDMKDSLYSVDSCLNRRILEKLQSSRCIQLQGSLAQKIFQSKQREQFLGLHEEGFEFLISSVIQDMLFKAE